MRKKLKDSNQIWFSVICILNILRTLYQSQLSVIDTCLVLNFYISRLGSRLLEELTILHYGELNFTCIANLNLVVFDLILYYSQIRPLLVLDSTQI